MTALPLFRCIAVCLFACEGVIADVAASPALKTTQGPSNDASTATGTVNGVGWRGDRSGVFPAQTLLMNWDGVTGKNILWSTPMPSWSCASPVVVGNRVFCLSEPDFLLCLDADSGRLLWSREVSPLAGIPPDEAATAKAKWDALLAERHATRQLFHELRLLDTWDYVLEHMTWGKAGGKGKEPKLRQFSEGVPGNWTTWQSVADMIEDNASVPGVVLPDRQRLQQRADQVRAAIEKKGCDPKLAVWGTGGRYGNKEAETERAFRREMRKKSGFILEDWYGFIGMSFATPVSDGACVYVTFAYNQVAAYDFDGSCVWHRSFQWKPESGKNPDLLTGCKYVASPLLVGDSLVFIANDFIRALNKKTGSLVWEKPHRFDQVGSPVCLNVDGQAVVVTPMGACYRATDGELLSPPLLKRGSSYTTPVVVDKTVYLVAGHMGDETAAYDMGYLADGRFAPRCPWQTNLNFPGDSPIWVGPIYHKERLYYHGVRTFHVQDARTGKLLSTMTHTSGLPKHVDGGGPNPVLVNDTLYLTGTSGDTMVLNISKEPPGILSVNHIPSDHVTDLARVYIDLTMEEWNQKWAPRELFNLRASMCASPFVSGDRVYLRSYDKLWCVGVR